MALQTYIGGLTNEQKIFYSDLLLDRALPNLLHSTWAIKKPIPANSGNVINFRRFELIDGSPSSISALTEGTAGANSSPSISAVSATISQYGRWMEGTELLEDMAMDPVVTEFTTVFGEQAGIDMDIVVREVLLGGSNVQYASTATVRGSLASGMYLSGAEVREILRTMQRNNVRPPANAGGKYVAIIHPDTWHDMVNDTDIKSALTYAADRGSDNPLFTGETHDYMGIKWVVTTNAKIYASVGGSGADVYATIVLGDQAYGISDLDNQSLKMYYKPRGSAGTADPLEQKWTLGYKCAFACMRLNDKNILRVEHVTSAKNAS